MKIPFLKFVQETLGQIVRYFKNSSTKQARFDVLQVICF